MLGRGRKSVWITGDFDWVQIFLATMGALAMGLAIGVAMYAAFCGLLKATCN